MDAAMSSPITFAFVLILLVLGILMVFSPVRLSRLLHWLARPQRELLRGGSLFDIYWPERVEQSRQLRVRIRLLGAVFLAFGVMIAFSK